MKDMKGTVLQKGMYVIYAVEHYDSLEQRIGLVLEVKDVNDKPSVLRIRSVRKHYSGKWEKVRSSGLTNERGIFVVSSTHIPDDVQLLLNKESK